MYTANNQIMNNNNYLSDIIQNTIAKSVLIFANVVMCMQLCAYRVEIMEGCEQLIFMNIL